ncbi:hypothetical protein DFJ77DRAFT_443973 [Powellomyces hirtus]|nr:hypothetical protein DFJ77DRAFT_443973 [Powellomyces hirtus]
MGRRVAYSPSSAAGCVTCGYIITKGSLRFEEVWYRAKCFYHFDCYHINPTVTSSPTDFDDHSKLTEADKERLVRKIKETDVGLILRPKTNARRPDATSGPAKKKRRLTNKLALSPSFVGLLQTSYHILRDLPTDELNEMLVKLKVEELDSLLLYNQQRSWWVQKPAKGKNICRMVIEGAYPSCPKCVTGQLETDLSKIRCMGRREGAFLHSCDYVSDGYTGVPWRWPKTLIGKSEGHTLTELTPNPPNQPPPHCCVMGDKLQLKAAMGSGRGLHFTAWGKGADGTLHRYYTIRYDGFPWVNFRALRETKRASVGGKSDTTGTTACPGQEVGETPILREESFAVGFQ